MAASTSRKSEKPLNENPPSDSESDDSRDEEGWNDVEDEEEEVPEVISLLDDRVFPDVISMLDHCKDKHNFDFLGVRQRLRLDFHGCVKLVNFSGCISSHLIPYLERRSFFVKPCLAGLRSQIRAMMNVPLLLSFKSFLFLHHQSDKALTLQQFGNVYMRVFP